jgi:hypothetical protein
MSKKVWKGDAVSIILLPSGEQGEEILKLALDWSRSWLLTPALWMLADDIPDFPKDTDIDNQVPPDLKAYLLGRDSDQNPVKEEVSVFWTLGSQAFKTIRFIAVRTEQNLELMKRTSIGAESAARFIELAVPGTSSQMQKYNLIIAPTNEKRLLEGILSSFWNANLIAAAEDRSTPLSTDSFVKTSERYIGFALAHIATTAGLWAGLPVSSAELKGEKNQLGQARLQRVFVRGVTNDALSADVAHWALQKLNYTDTNFEISLVEGQNVVTIAAEFEDYYMNQLVEHILKGPTDGQPQDNFLFRELPEPDSSKVKIGLLRKIIQRLEDMGTGLASIPKWIKASAEYRLEYAIDDERDEEILYSALPKRLLAKVKAPTFNLKEAQASPGGTEIPTASAALWRHMRESISAAIDAPSLTDHPEVLKDKDHRHLVFATVDLVLPSPEAKWVGDEFKDKSIVRFEDIGWLGALPLRKTKEEVERRIQELAPGIEDAQNQLSETQKFVDEAKVHRDKVKEELELTERELKSDEELAARVSESHTHKLPKVIVGPSERPKQKANASSSGSIPRLKKVEQVSTSVLEIPNESNPTKVSFFRKLFRRKGSE